MSKHTPGPWKVLTKLGKKRVAVCTDNTAPKQAVIAEMNNQSVEVDYNERICNARLIAAAPDLLEALNNCDLLAGYQSDNYQDLSLALGEIRTIARAAIAKATGGQND
jgi:hypothetical protein